MNLVCTMTASSHLRQWYHTKWIHHILTSFGDILAISHLATSIVLTVLLLYHQLLLMVLMVHVVALLGNGWFALVDVLKLMTSIRPLKKSLLRPLLLLHDLLLLMDAVATGWEVYLVVMIGRETVIVTRIYKHVMLVLLLLQLLLPRAYLMERIIIDIGTVTVMVNWVVGWAVAISGETGLTRVGVGIQVVSDEGRLQNLTSIHGALHERCIVHLRSLSAYPRW